jgi:hypothetical protein
MVKVKKSKRTGSSKPKPARKQKAKVVTVSGSGIGARVPIGVNRVDLVKVARMIADPCNAEVDLNGFASTEGIGLRVFDTFDQSSATGGYAIWFPSYCCPGAGSGTLTGINLINSLVLNTSVSSVGPTNTDAVPFGSTAGSSYSDPAYNWVSGTSVADARTHAACFQMRYTGAVSSASGLVATLTNIPMDLFTGGTFPSVDQMFQQSRHITRLDFDIHEVKHRPDEGINSFYDTSDGPFLMNVGAANGRTGESASGVAAGPRAIGFAWKGVPASSITFTRYKVLEWRPNRGAGMPAVPIRSSGQPIINEALRKLDEEGDRRGYDWTTQAQKVAEMVKEVFAPGADVAVRSVSGAAAAMLARRMSALTI